MRGVGCGIYYPEGRGRGFPFRPRGTRRARNGERRSHPLACRNEPFMPAAERNAVLRYLRRLVDAPGAGAVADAQLLERFVAGRDEAVFELLLWRHAAMVLDVCQGVLRDAHAAGDACQASFLALARKAASIGKGESLGGGLYGVAYRVELKARARGAKQPDGPPQPLDALAARAADPADAAALRELRPLLYEE